MVRRYRRGDVLFHQGDDAGAVLVLIGGHVKAAIMTDGREVILGVPRPGRAARRALRGRRPSRARARCARSTTSRRSSSPAARSGRTSSSRPRDRARAPALGRRAPARGRPPARRLRRSTTSSCASRAGWWTCATATARRTRPGSTSASRSPRTSWPRGRARPARPSPRRWPCCARSGWVQDRAPADHRAGPRRAAPLRELTPRRPGRAEGHAPGATVADGVVAPLGRP